jgi:hypothetical protein
MAKGKPGIPDTDIFNLVVWGLNRPTSDEFECESCGEWIFEREAEECETCSRGCCSLCSPESICEDCRG